MKPFLVVVFLTQLCNLANAKLSAEQESVFTKASLEYRTGNYSKALEWINSQNDRDKLEFEFLELRALTFKALNQTDKAKKDYRTLFNAARKRRDHEKKAVYAFELGALALNEKAFAEGEGYLRVAIDSNFNVYPSYFLLGKTYFENKDWEKANDAFLKLDRSTNSSLRAVSKIYLAQISAKENQMNDSLSYFVEAREISLEDPMEELSRQVLKTADKELRSYHQSRLSADVGTSSGYDSNVLSVPNSSDSGASSSPGSFKQSLFWGLGYSTSPVSSWQFLGSYKGSVNYNSNAETKSGQFFSHEIATFLTRGPLKKLQYGMKIASAGILQYQTDAFRPYSLALLGGPYLKWQASKNVLLGAETYFEAKRHYLDPTLFASQRRSGWEQSLKTYIVSAKPNKIWTPGGYLTGTYSHPDGAEFRGFKISMDLVNTHYLSQNWVLSESIGTSGSWYPDHPSDRKDQYFYGGLSVGCRISTPITLTANGQYGRNLSTLTAFRYDRWSALASFNYRFL